MANHIWRPAGDPPVPIRAVDNGDGTYTLSTVTGATRAAGDQIIRLAGDRAVPFLAKSNGDGTFSLALAISASFAAGDQRIRLAGDPPIPFLAKSNGDGTFSLAIFAGAPGAGDIPWRPAGSLSPLLAHNNGDGTYSLGGVVAGTRGGGDGTVTLAGDPALPFLAKSNGNGTFSLAMSSVAPTTSMLTSQATADSAATPVAPNATQQLFGTGGTAAPAVTSPTKVDSVIATVNLAAAIDGTWSATTTALTPGGPVVLKTTPAIAGSVLQRDLGSFTLPTGTTAVTTSVTVTGGTQTGSFTGHHTYRTSSPVVKGSVIWYPDSRQAGYSSDAIAGGGPPPYIFGGLIPPDATDVWVKAGASAAVGSADYTAEAIQILFARTVGGTLDSEGTFGGAVGSTAMPNHFSIAPGLYNSWYWWPGATAYNYDFQVEFGVAKLTAGVWTADDLVHQLPAADSTNTHPSIHFVQAPPDATLCRSHCTQVDGRAGSRVFYCQVWTVNASRGHIAHPLDYIDPTVPTGWSQFSLGGAYGVQSENYDWVMGGTVGFEFSK